MVHCHFYSLVLLTLCLHIPNRVAPYVLPVSSHPISVQYLVADPYTLSLLIIDQIFFSKRFLSFCTPATVSQYLLHQNNFSHRHFHCRNLLKISVSNFHYFLRLLVHFFSSQFTSPCFLLHFTVYIFTEKAGFFFTLFFLHKSQSIVLRLCEFLCHTIFLLNTSFILVVFFLHLLHHPLWTAHFWAC